MVWTAMTNPLVGEATKKIAFADVVIGNLSHLYANMGSSSGGGNLVPNGDFELDSNSDDIPDGWDITEYTAGAFAINTATPGQGARGIQFTSPGASGGGYAQSTDFFPVSPAKNLFVDFLTWASVATIHNLLEIRWYSTALEANYISTTSIYDSVTNPLTVTRYTGGATPPATARYAKVRVTGAKNDVAVAGIGYFDSVSVSESRVSTVVGYASGGNAHDTTTLPDRMKINGTLASATGFAGPTGVANGVVGDGSVDVTLHDLDDALQGTLTLALPGGTWVIYATSDWINAGPDPVDYHWVITAIAIRE